MKTKTFFLTAMMIIICGLAANAQSYRYSRYYNHSTNRLDYSNGGRSHFDRGYGYYYGMSPYGYVGMRIGASLTTVPSDNEQQKATGVRTGLNLGLAAGVSLSHRAPLFFETGLYYTQKGGRQNNNAQQAYNLDYLEVPLTMKYVFSPNGRFTLQPYVGGYLACGVNGKVKDYDNRKSYDAFGDGKNDLQRFDGGLKVGCGISYDMLYAEVAYEHGLSDISRDNFSSTRNSAVMLNVGVNF